MKNQRKRLPPKMNKGEWSEIYAFLKILADGKIDSADAHLQVIPGQSLKIKNIIRACEGNNNNTTYNILHDLGVIRFSLAIENINELKQETLQNVAHKVLEIILASEGSFEINDPTYTATLNQLGNPKLKSQSLSKRDIDVTAIDTRSGQDEVSLGFSIKSKLGGASTLFNASKDSTNFLYKLNIPEELHFNQIADDIIALPIQKKLKQIKESNVFLEFKSVVSDAFNQNLRMADTQMGDIIGCLVKHYYTSDKSKIIDLIKLVESEDPLKFGTHRSIMYSHKIKEFLHASALGMTAAHPWQGIIDATGGYIVVKEDGHLVCYHIYNMNEFKDYLLNNTFLDTPSTKRHAHGHFFDINGEWFVKLNLQIRFK